jgi:dTDP-glucose pyrophosphorylase
MSWQSVALTGEKTVREALESLNATQMRIVLIVDDSFRLLGTVTDGDIRRALMHGHGMDSLVIDVMEKDPTTIGTIESQRKVRQIMREKDLLHLPVIDARGIVVGLETMQDLVFDSPRPNPVLLMVGGLGKRLYPLTRDVPKPLLPVGKKPILQTILEQLVEAGFSRFFLAVHYRSEQVQAHFGNGSNWGVSIEYLEEKQPLGTAGALSLLDSAAINAPLLMMNGDLLTGLDFGQLVDYHGEHGGLATMCVRKYDFQIPYGVVRGDGVQVAEITEKPVQKFFVNAGIYVLEPQLVNQCNVEQSKDMPDLLQATVEAGGQVNMYPIHEYWLDIGRMEEYERAQVDAIDLNSL